MPGGIVVFEGLYNTLFQPSVTCPFHSIHRTLHHCIYHKSSLPLYYNYNICLFIMKAATLISLFAQVAYVLSVPAPIEDGVETSSLEDRQVEVPDSLTKRGNCWYKDHPNAGPVTCSKSGWCYGHCSLQTRDDWWCWFAYNRGQGDWVSCKSNADCSIAINKSGGKSAWCRGTCYC